MPLRNCDTFLLVGAYSVSVFSNLRSKRSPDKYKPRTIDVIVLRFLPSLYDGIYYQFTSGRHYFDISCQCIIGVVGVALRELKAISTIQYKRLTALSIKVFGMTQGKVHFNIGCGLIQHVPRVPQALLVVLYFSSLKNIAS